MQFTAHEAQYVLATLITRKQLRLAQVRAALRGRLNEIRQLRERLAALEELDGRSGRRPGKPRGAKRKMTPRVRSLRRQQGRYMGLVRRLKPAEKARVRAVREKKGLPPAIRLAESLARKS